MKHAGDESAWDDTCQYLPFKLVMNMFKKFFMKRIAFFAPGTHFTL